jgi:cytochrome c-type biogenesis protein CcmE
MGVTNPVPPAPRVRQRASKGLWAVGIIVAAMLGLLLAQGLGNATLYFRTASEAVKERASLGTKRFRIEGVVVNGSVHRVGQDVGFTIEDGDVTVPVHHRGDPPQLFKPGLPVVLEGRFASKAPNAAFDSDRIMVKHSEDYQAKHPDRLNKAKSQ